MKKSDLPFGSEFSPSQIELKTVLEFAKDSNGNWNEFEKKVRVEYFQSNKTSDYNKGKLANNTKLGMIAYGIIDRKSNLTGLGDQMYSARNHPAKLYDILARYILLNLHGMGFTQCIQDMTTSGEVVNLTTLRKGLGIRGIHYPSGGKHPSIMRLWLSKAGVFEGNTWRINETKIEELVKVTTTQYEELAQLTEEQKAFILALVNTGKMDPQPANEIAKLASATFGVSFPEKSLPKLVLNDLEEKDYIIKEKTTTGRGAKPFLVSPTKKLEKEIIEPLLKQISLQTDPKLHALLKKSIEDILKNGSSQRCVDEHII